MNFDMLVAAVGGSAPNVPLPANARVLQPHEIAAANAAAATTAPVPAPVSTTAAATAAPPSGSPLPSPSGGGSMPVLAPERSRSFGAGRGATGGGGDRYKSVTAAAASASSNAAAAAAAASSSSTSTTSSSSSSSHAHTPTPAVSASAASAPSPPISYPIVPGRALPKRVYARALLLHVGLQSPLVKGQPAPPSLFRPELQLLIRAGVEGYIAPDPTSREPAAASGAAKPARAPPGFKAVPTPTTVPSAKDKEKAGGKDGAALLNRWNEPRSERAVERGDRVESRSNDRNDRDRGDRNDRDRRGNDRGDRNDRYESTPSWATAEVKNALDSSGNDDDTFGSGGDSSSDFVLGATLDREADAKVMAKMGWGPMFKASEDLERRAAEEREEIRRKLREDEEQEEAQRAGNFNSDFEVLPEEHPLMQAKAAALRAASSAASSSSGPTPSDLSNVSSDDELAKLDELLAAKAKAEAASAAAKKLGSVPEEPVAASSRPAQPQQGQWAGLMAKPAVISPSESSSAASAGTSKFASRFGFGLQDEAADPWASPVPSASAAAPVPAVGAPKSSQWGFSLEDSAQPQSSAAAAFAATPNTIQPRSQPPLHIMQQQQQQAQAQGQGQQHYMQHGAAPEYRQIDLARMFEQAGAASSSSGGALLPSMPAHSGVALATPPPQAAPTPMVEDSLQRLLSKQKNRKQGGGPTGPAVPTSMLHSQTQQILPAHLLGQTPQQHGSAYAPYAASSIPPPQPQLQQAPVPSASLPQPSAALLTNPTFLSLPPHQQQQYLRHWQEQQQRGTVAPQPQQQQQQPQRMQPPHQQQQQGQYHPQQPQQQLPSHYAPVPQQQRGGPAQGYPAPSNLPPHQQQQQQSQQPPRNPMHQPHGLIPSNYPQQSNLPPHQQMYQQPLPHSSSQPQPQQQHGLMHGGRMPPNHGVVPTTYGYSAAPVGGVAAPADGAAGGDGLSRWFAHLSTANLPAVPAQATQYNVMQQQQQQQQRPPHQQQRY